MAEAKKEKAVEPVPKKAEGDSNLMGALAYLFGLITGIIMYVVKPEDRYVRFHAVQSILLNVALIVIFIVASIVMVILAFLPVAGQICALLIYPVLMLGSLLLWLFMMYKAYSGERYKLPYIGEMAEKYV